MTAKLLKLKQDRAAAFAAMTAAKSRAEAKDVTAEAKVAATKEWDESLILVEKLDGEIEAEQREADTQAAADRDRRNRTAATQTRAGPRTVERSATPATTPRVEGVRDRAQDDPNRGFRNSRDFYLSVMEDAMGVRADDRLAPLRATAGSDEQGEYSNPHGGFLIPVGFRPDLMTLGHDSDPTLGRTMQVPMDAPSITFNARTDKNHTSSVTGGLRVYRRKETQAVESSRMEMEQITLKVNSLMGVNFQTEELLADSPVSVAAFIEQGFREELGSKILSEKLNGTGAGEMLGVLSTGNECLIEIAKEAGQAADTIVYKNVLNMRARCWRYNDAIWIANPDTLPTLAQLALVIGTSGIPQFTSGNGGDVPDTLMGRPIFFSEYAETLGDKGDLILGNWSQYVEGAIGGIESAESIHVRFLNNERAFRMSLRNDGRPWWRTAINPKKGANTLSPFVTLAARA
jgi:HK97 family phage major capsid protein